MRHSHGEVKTLVFSKRFNAMPKSLWPTYIKNMTVRYFRETTLDLLDSLRCEDEESREIATSKVIILELVTKTQDPFMSESYAWFVAKRWTKDRERFFRNLIGKEIEIEVESDSSTKN